MHVYLHKIDTRENQFTRKSLLARDEQVATIVSPLTPSTVRPHPSTAGTNDGSEKYSHLCSKHVRRYLNFCGFKKTNNLTSVNKYFGVILNSWIALPMKNTKLNVQ